MNDEGICQAHDDVHLFKSDCEDFQPTSYESPYEDDDDPMGYNSDSYIAYLNGN